MKATALKDFPGVPDGKVHPQEIKAGDEISGELARIAVAGGLAKAIVEPSGKSAAATAADKVGKGGKTGKSKGKTAAEDEGGAVEIPDDWQELGADALVSLASSLTDQAVADAETAIATIEAELARRAAD